jgi:hypothetical protein
MFSPGKSSPTLRERDVRARREDEKAGASRDAPAYCLP